MGILQTNAMKEFQADDGHMFRALVTSKVRFAKGKVSSMGGRAGCGWGPGDSARLCPLSCEGDVRRCCGSQRFRAGSVGAGSCPGKRGQTPRTGDVSHGRSEPQTCSGGSKAGQQKKQETH